jgi:hypothetical protein
MMAWFVALLVAPSSAVAKARWFGYNDNSTLTGALTPKADARLLARTGANANRIGVEWSRVQPTAGGPYQFREFDTIFRTWRKRGVRPVLVVDNAPRWAWPAWVLCFDGQDCHYPPDRSHDADWARFVAAVAARYPGAAGIEVWNEPNTRFFWATGPDPARYTELLREARAAVKRVDPGMPVLGASLASIAGNGDATPTGTVPFLRGMYASGARGLMDGISMHPYPGARLDGGSYEMIDNVLAVRDEAGDTAPLWLTEVGLSTTGGRPLGGYGEAFQAVVLRDLVRRLRRRPEVKGVFVHTLADPPAPRSYNTEDGFGIVRSAIQPKAAYCALAVTRRHCAAPRAPAPLLNAWEAQERLQRAVEATLAYKRAHGSFEGLTNTALHALASRLSALAPHSAQPAGPDSDPSRIAILPRDNGELRLCNASRSTMSFCVTISAGAVFRFTAADGSIATVDGASDGPGTYQW